MYDIDDMYALWTGNTSESDPHSYEATKVVAQKAQKEFWGFNGIPTHDLLLFVNAFVA